MEDEKFVRNGLIEERVDVRGLEMQQPALNFTVFLDKVENGTKCQSIRLATEHNKRIFKVGKPIKLYTGMEGEDL